MNKQAEEVLDNFKDKIASILKCNSNRIKIYTKVTLNQGDPTQKEAWAEIGELCYYKPDVQGWTQETYLTEWKTGEYKVSFKSQGVESVISTWKMYQLPHCCAYAVSCNVVVEAKYRKLGIGTALNKLRIEIAKLLGYSAMLCTDIEKNAAQRNILRVNGWKDIHTVNNKRTKNKVFLSVMEL